MEFPQYLALALFKSVWWFKKYSLILYELSNPPLKPSTLVALQHQLIVNSILQFATVLHVLYQEKKVYTIHMQHCSSQVPFPIQPYGICHQITDINLHNKWPEWSIQMGNWGAIYSICIRSFPYGSVQVSMLLLKNYWHDYGRKIESSLSIFLFMLLKYKL